MIARFIDGPLRGQDREVPDATDYLQVYDLDATLLTTYLKFGFQQMDEVQLFCSAPVGFSKRQGLALWVDRQVTYNDLPLTDADQELLRGMRIKV